MKIHYHIALLFFKSAKVFAAKEKLEIVIGVKFKTCEGLTFAKFQVDKLLTGLYVICYTLIINLMADGSEKISIGTVIEALPNATFRVRLDNGREIFTYLSGKMRLHRIKILVGDKVKIQLSPDGAKGRIIHRL